MTIPRRPRIGLALGGGSARGWAHVGVIQALEQAGIRPDVVCGTSIGALVGAAYAAGELDRFEQWVRGMSVRGVISLMDVGLSGGVLKGERVMEYFRRNFVDRPIEDLAMPFAAVATVLDTGMEIWLRTGSTVDAVRASIALPALFTPVLRDGQMLVDGSLVNPVPVSLVRAMGAEIVIAVDLSSDMLEYYSRLGAQPDAPAGQANQWVRKLKNNLVRRTPENAPDKPRVPSLLEVVTASLNIMQVRLTRSRMAGDPPDVIITPRLARLGLLDFHRADEAIAEGKRAVEEVLHSLRALKIPAL